MGMYLDAYVGSSRLRERPAQVDLRLSAKISAGLNCRHRNRRSTKQSSAQMRPSCVLEERCSSAIALSSESLCELQLTAAGAGLLRPRAFYSASYLFVSG
jgi:hypothetical protein